MAISSIAREEVIICNTGLRKRIKKGFAFDIHDFCGEVIIRSLYILSPYPFTMRFGAVFSV